VEESSIPDCFEVTARADEDEVMGLRHKEYVLEGVQFHPESFLTEVGPNIIQNFFEL
jgi:anthranilate/para-aminobenzoate synthase component II